MLERSRRVVLLIDYDNLQICASRDTPGRDLQLVPVVQLAQRYGSVVVARAYAEWNLSTERLAVYKAGIEPAFAPVLRTESDRSGKSLADTVMVAEGMDMLWTLSPDVVVLATSDKDLIPLVRVAKQRGAFVVVLGSDFTAIPLREMADEHVTYKQLITDASGRYTTEAGPARQPAALPEPARRRSRERNGRESRAAAASATGSGSGSGSAAPSQKEAPAPRAERESPAAPAQAAAPSTPEPVAPVTAASPGETDGQIGSRRRRRRGSRRRSERLGSAGEATPTGDHADVSEEAAPEASDIEVAQASSGTVEAPVSAFDAGVPPPPSEPTVPAESGTTVVEVTPEPAAASAEAPAAPRERRRRTRRPAAGADTIAASAEEAASSAPPSSDASAAVEPTITPTTPAPPGDAVAEGNGSPEAANGESAEPPAAAPAPARRARRVASAARGRLR